MPVIAKKTGDVKSSDVEKLKPLPQLLTLKVAVKQADGNHPSLLKQKSELDLAKAKKLSIKASNGLNLSVDGQLKYVEPFPGYSNQENNDSQLGIVARKRIYDFGRTRSKMKAANFQIKSSELVLHNAKDQHRLNIMQAYFSVLLTDIAYARDNEAMATAYVTFDKVRTRNKIGQVSDIELLKRDTAYHAARSTRYASDVARRIARSRLANLMNRAGNLPAKLAVPTLDFSEQKLPDSNAIFQLAMKNNYRLLALNAAVGAARRNISAAKAGRWPVLEAEVGAYEYNREIGAQDTTRASLNIRIPLFTGGKVKAKVAHYTAIYYQKLGELRVWQLKLRQAALELRQALYVLRARRDQMNKLAEYRELALDKARALYELDVRKTLGGAMVRQTAARYEAAKVTYQLLLTWARMNILQGKDIFYITVKKKKQV